MNNWTVIKEPFPHVVFNGDEKIYDYVKGNWDHYFKNGPTYKTPRFIKCHYEDPILLNYMYELSLKAYTVFNIKNIINSEMYYEINENNEEGKQDGYINRGPHHDNLKKLVVGLWYFRDPNDDGKGGLGLHDINRDLCTEVPYEENKIVIFKNDFKAFHSVMPRKITEYKRKSIYFCI